MDTGGEKALGATPRATSRGGALYEEEEHAGALTGAKEVVSERAQARQVHLTCEGRTDHGVYQVIVRGRRVVRLVDVLRASALTHTPPTPSCCEPK